MHEHYEVCVYVTIRLLHAESILRAPSHRVYVSGVNLTPVVIVVAPPIKMDQQLPVPHSRDASHTSECRVLAVFSFQSHPHLEAMLLRLQLGLCSMASFLCLYRGEECSRMNVRKLKLSQNLGTLESLVTFGLQLLLKQL